MIALKNGIVESDSDVEQIYGQLSSSVPGTESACMKFFQPSRQNRVLATSTYRNVRKRLTPTNVIIIFAGLACVYFFFQLYSMRLINRSHGTWGKEYKHSKNVHERVRDVETMDRHYERKVTDELAKTKLKYSPKKQKTGKMDMPKTSPVRREQAELREKENKVKEELQSIKRLRPSGVPRGVNPKKLHHYMKNVKGKFKCITSKEIISYSRVNDDYCDCSDGSDEPGTAACANSKFFCDYQLKDDEFSIPSNRVNDGICDCCDGSDEYDDVVVLEQFRLHGKTRKYLVQHAPCEDQCHKKEKEKLERLEMQMKGIQIKKEYLEEAKKYPVQNSKKFGPGGIFYKLSLKCFDWKGTEYEYAVCPFKHVKQQKFPQPEVDLGHFSEWVSSRPGNYQLQMTGGDSQLCPGGRRQTLIKFQCGFEDKVLNLREDEKCKYVVDFATPVAC